MNNLKPWQVILILIFAIIVFIGIMTLMIKWLASDNYNPKYIIQGIDNKQYVFDSFEKIDTDCVKLHGQMHEGDIICGKYWIFNVDTNDNNPYFYKAGSFVTSSQP